MKHLLNIGCLLITMAAITACHKKSNNAVKTKGLDGNRNWQGYSTVDRFYYSHIGADSSSRNDTSSSGTNTFALSVLGNTQIMYGKQVLTLSASTDSVKTYTSDMVVSATRTLHTDIYYYHYEDSIIISAMLTAAIADTPVKEVDKYYSRQWTY